MDQERPWAARIAAEIGERVAFYRDSAGLSAQQLADRCAKLGMPSISRVVITKLENKHREAVSTAELQVLAQALDVPPVLLLFPLGHAPAVEVLPGADVDPWAAIEWFTGNIADPADPDHQPADGDVQPGRAVESAPAVRRRDTRDQRHPGRGACRWRVTGLRRVREIMRESGLMLPPLHPDTARVLGEEAADVAR